MIHERSLTAFLSHHLFKTCNAECKKSSAPNLMLNIKIHCKIEPEIVNYTSALASSNCKYAACYRLLYRNTYIGETQKRAKSIEMHVTFVIC